MPEKEGTVMVDIGSVKTEEGIFTRKFIAELESGDKLRVSHRFFSGKLSFLSGRLEDLSAEQAVAFVIWTKALRGKLGRESRGCYWAEIYTSGKERIDYGVCHESSLGRKVSNLICLVARESDEGKKERERIAEESKQIRQIFKNMALNRS